MYSSYTTLQRAQLAKQEYLDTQEVFLGVYAPGRNAELSARSKAYESSLENILSSSSWKLTQPLRRLLGLFHRSH